MEIRMGCSLHDGQFAPSSCLRRRAGQFDRGVPINREGYFFVPLWTDFQPGPGPGILDWFTVLLALTSVRSWPSMAANYLVMKAEGAFMSVSS